jgi:hypothetical protein
LYLAGDSLGDIALQIQYVANVTFVSLHPQMSIGGRVNQLRPDAHPIT